MKHSNLDSNKRYVIAISSVIICVLSLSGCAVVTTSVAPPNGPIEGMVYHLPASYLKVSIESKKDAKGNHSELIVATGPEIVPDKDARLTLKINGNELFTRNHTFAFTNGLLSTVTTNDEGKSADIISTLASIAMNVISFGALPAHPLTPSAAAVGHESPTPSNNEIMAALSSIAPGRQDFLFRLTKKTATTDLPGTAKLLGFSAEIPDLPTAAPLKINAADLTCYEGIATRVLEPYRVDISLNLKLAVLYANRINTYNETIADLGKTIEQTTKTIKDLQGELAKVPVGSAAAVDLNAKIAGAEKTLKESKESHANALSRKSDNEGFLKAHPSNEEYVIANQSSLILIPDYSPTVKISLKRAPMGTTKFLLTLNRGILTDYHAEHPSTTLEIVKVPLNITESVVKLPTEILQLKIDYSSKAQALAEQQSKYQDALKAIADKKKGPSAYDEQVKSLDQEKAILQLQKEIAQLKNEISKIETP